MINILITLLVMLLLTVIFIAAMVTIEALDRLRELLKTAALDAMQVWIAANNARLDVETRQEELQFTVLKNTTELEHWRDYGRLQIAQQRQKLIGTVPGEHSE